jgi:hypothetical protein
LSRSAFFKQQGALLVVIILIVSSAFPASIVLAVELVALVSGYRLLLGQLIVAAFELAAASRLLEARLPAATAAAIASATAASKERPGALAIHPAPLLLLLDDAH